MSVGEWVFVSVGGWVFVAVGEYLCLWKGGCLYLSV